MNPSGTEAVRRALLNAYAAAVSAVEGERVVADWLGAHPPGRQTAVIALGKAAGAMALGAQRALGGHLGPGLVVTKSGHADAALIDGGRFLVCEGAHPIPDESSLAAGQALLKFIETLPAAMPVLVLISGGASALVEVLRPGVDLEALARVNGWLLANGRSIDEINAVRRRLSLLKGGGLAGLLAPRPVTGLLISDVEGDQPAVIGSGPLNPPAEPGLPPGLPEWMVAMLPAEAPAAAGPAVAEVVVAATLDDALRAAEASLVAAGLAVHRYDQHLLGDIDQAVHLVTGALGAGPQQVHLWGGEVTLMLPPAPGRGGRNQQLALRLAVAIDGPAQAAALCAGTDGTDGPTEDAGGLVDNLTLARGRAADLSAADHLQRADAGSFLEATGDLISTGPTGTNVTDIVMAWRA
jgi:hydroxypyruvate reductase